MRPAERSHPAADAVPLRRGHSEWKSQPWNVVIYLNGIRLLPLTRGDSRFVGAADKTVIDDFFRWFKKINVKNRECPRPHPTTTTLAVTMRHCPPPPFSAVSFPFSLCFLLFHSLAEIWYLLFDYDMRLGRKAAVLWIGLFFNSKASLACCTIFFVSLLSTL